MTKGPERPARSGEEGNMTEREKYILKRMGG